MKFNQHVLLEPEVGGEPQATGGGSTPPPATPPADPAPSGLPSDQGDPASFEIKPEDLTDGKFQGKWSNPQEMADYIKTIEE